jgi:hypothetical protein
MLEIKTSVLDVIRSCFRKYPEIPETEFAKLVHFCTTIGLSFFGRAAPQRFRSGSLSSANNYARRRILHPKTSKESIHIFVHLEQFKRKFHGFYAFYHLYLLAYLKMFSISFSRVFYFFRIIRSWRTNHIPPR